MNRRRRLPAAVVRASTADASDAAAVYDDALEWWSARAEGFTGPLAVEVWAYDRTLSHVVLVHHRWRGWVPPGGAVEFGELPRDAAMRELSEETSVHVEALPHVAAVAVRQYHEDWTPTLGLSYAVVLDATAVELAGESGQSAAWKPLAETWDSVFPDDRDRIKQFAVTLGGIRKTE